MKPKEAAKYGDGTYRSLADFFWDTKGAEEDMKLYQKLDIRNFDKEEKDQRKHLTYPMFKVS